MSSPNDELRLNVADAGRAGRLRVGGELDISTADVLLARLTALLDSPEDIELDMSQVTFCDSSGLRSVLVAHELLAERGRTLRIVSPSAQVARLLDLSGLESLLRTPTED